MIFLFEETNVHYIVVIEQGTNGQHVEGFGMNNSTTSQGIDITKAIRDMRSCGILITCILGLLWVRPCATCAVGIRGFL